MADAGAGGKLKVFISYSRKDSGEFADELLAGLVIAGFAPFLDRHDIVPGEPWEARLGGLIEQSDTVVFVVSPEAVKSDRCTWEVDRTLELSKRLLPVIFKSVPDQDVPEKLRRLQFVRFDSGIGFARPLSQLAEALRVDLGWIREHTRLGEIATRWDSRGRPESLLLRGDDLDAAKTWMSARKAEAPEITDLQRAFLNASNEAEIARASKERQQLEEMRRAQEARARSQKRAAWLLVGVAAMVLGILLRCHLGPLSRQLFRGVAAERTTPRELRVFERILEAHPKDVRKDEIAAAASYEASGGSFNNILGRLRSIGLIDYPRPGRVRAEDWLCL
jgi:hypothetical protein